jgi:PadR family transcriptional regulator, regulatory protein PadR
MQMEAQALKGLFHMLLLSVLLDGPLHPWAIQQVLQEHAETFTFGNDSVYTSLRRLEHKGLVSSIKVPVSGRTRRVFEITPAGREQLAADWAVWEAFTAVIRGIVHHHQDGERQELTDPAQSRA